MTIEKIQNGMTGEAAAQLIYDNDKELENLILALQTKDAEHDEAIQALQENDQLQDTAISVIPMIQQDISDIQLKDQQQDEAIQALQDSGGGDANRLVYVSPTAQQLGGDGSIEDPYGSPYMAFMNAKSDKVLMFKDGTYKDTGLQYFDSQNDLLNVKVLGYADKINQGYKKTIFDGGDDITNITKTAGYTKVYQFTRSMYGIDFLFQRNIPDSYIDSGDTRITKAYSINDIENSEEYKWFSEGNTVYFSAPSTDFAVNPIVIPAGSVMVGYMTICDIEFSKLYFKYCDISLFNFNHFHFIDCVFENLSHDGLTQYAQGVVKFTNCVFRNSQEFLCRLNSGGVIFDNCIFINPHTNMYAYSFELRNNAIFNNCQFLGINRIASIEQQTDITFNNCIFRDLQHGGIEIGDYSSNIKVWNCKFMNKPDDPIFTSYLEEQGGNLEFISNLYYHMEDPDAYSGEYMTKINDIFIASPPPPLI